MTSCGSGVTACALAFALHLIGHPGAAVYDGSWSEWGLPGDTPVETGPAACARAVTVLEDVITYLEMLERPGGRRVPAPLDKLALMRAENCTVSFYRYLYERSASLAVVRAAARSTTRRWRP